MKLILFLAFIGTIFADEIFKTCDQIDFCRNLRSRQPEEKYTFAAISSIEGAVASLTLTSDEGNVILTITSLADNTFRIKILEETSTRYELQDILDGEPATQDFTSTSQEAGIITLVTGSNKVVLTSSPLAIEVFNNDLSAVKLNADRLILENSETSQAFAFAIQFSQAKQVYGIHEHADSLALQNTEPGGLDPYRLRNLDAAGFTVGSTKGLYGAIPVLYGHSSTLTSGVFLHNAAQQWHEVTTSENSAEVYIMAEAGAFDLFVFLGPTPTEVVRQYVGLTGTAHLPQLWTLGYHQCRWNYDNQSDVKDVIANFDNYNFPMDAIWLDIEYTDGKRYFTWNPENFTDPIEMQQNISSTNRKLVTIMDPHIKVDENYPVYSEALEGDFFVKNLDGTNFEGDCWPGLSSYIDFLNPEARNFYSGWYSYEKFQKSTPTLAGIWNDMNEPSVFDDSLEKTMPNDAVHFGNVKHKEIHNIYGFLQTIATHKGLLDRDEGTKRPFILTRSHFAGSQRYTAFWTGDNAADWGYLAVSFPECLNANLLGIVFCGSDVGGFVGNPDVELLQRWYQAAAWTPFYRSHANMGTDRREPYLYPEDVQAVIRNALQQRYQHIPVWYTLFYEHTRNKDPIIRPLFYQYPNDVNVFKIDNQLLLGTDILVRAVAEPNVQSVQVYFPGGPDEFWFSVNNFEVHAGNGNEDIQVTLEAIPVYYKVNSVISTKRTVKGSTADTVNDPYTLYVNLNPGTLAQGTLYIDDYTSFKYQSDQEYLYIDFTATEDVVTITIIDDSNYDGLSYSIEEVIVNTISELPQNKKPGVYKQMVYKSDVNGKLFTDFKFDGKQDKIVLKLK